MGWDFLRGVRVLDLTEHIAGPYAGKMFGDAGADVIKIESPAGDPSRRHGPFLDDIPNPETSAMFLHLNRNKRGITLNLETKTGQNLFKEMVKKADIVLESYGPGTMESWGLGEAELLELNPKLVFGRLSPFGQTGPYKNYRGNELIYYAWGPLLSSGDPELGPIKKTLHMVECQVGTAFAMSVMGALLAAKFKGIGQQVDMAAYETQVGSVDRRAAALLTHQYNGEIASREKPVVGALPNGVFPCLDGYVQIVTMPAWIPRMLKTLNDEGLNQLFQDPTAHLNPDNSEKVLEVLYPWLMSHPKQELFQQAQANGWPVVPFQFVEDVVQDPHFQERGFFVELEHPVVGKQTYSGPAWRVDGEGYPNYRPAPLLGQHNEEIYVEELGLSKSDLVHLRQLGII